MTVELDHIGLSVSDFEAAKKFYAAALAPLRIGVIMEFGKDVTGNEPVVGLGATARHSDEAAASRAIRSSSARSGASPSSFARSAAASPRPIAGPSGTPAASRSSPEIARVTSRQRST